jgi:prepilin-type N-terminal cleavage/methylation domain-containing protein/prepilin-type processing-associated H-X9-DG protein
MKKRHGFSLVELLVVVGIISVLISILLPALNKARAQAKRVQCASNLRQCGVTLLMYAQENNGWIVPVGEWIPQSGVGDDGSSTGPEYESLGENFVDINQPWNTWPAVVFKLTNVNHNILDPTAYAPDIMRCPLDLDSQEDLNNRDNCWGGHSYVINKHLVDLQNQVKKYGSKMGTGLDVSRVTLLGEKVTTLPDYYLETITGVTELSEFSKLIDLYKHGTKNGQGANYLFMDLHVDSQAPAQAFGAIDPWAIASAPTPSGG